MKKNKKEITFYTILILTLIMVNPPIINLVNNYAINKPLTFGYPTLWIWLQVWYGIAIVDFLIAAITLKSWKKDY